MYCPKCGNKLNVEGAKFCVNCGYSLAGIFNEQVSTSSHPQRLPDQPSQVERLTPQPSNGEFVCSSCRSEISYGEKICPNCGENIEYPPEFDDAYRRAFVGEKSDYYLKKWDSVERNWLGITLNAPALILGTVWLVYRKMYLYAWLSFVLDVTIWILMNRIYAAVQQGSALVFDLSTTVLAYQGLRSVLAIKECLLGMFGNRLYMIHMRRKVESIEDSQISDTAALAQASKVGRTALPEALGVLVLEILVVVALFA